MASSAASPATIRLAPFSTPCTCARSTARLISGDRPKSSALKTNLTKPPGPLKPIAHDDMRELGQTVPQKPFGHPVQAQEGPLQELAARFVHMTFGVRWLAGRY